MKTPLRASVLSLLAATASVLHAASSIQTVFYDMSAGLLPAVMPAPSAQLAVVAGYPDDPARLTFIARLYLPDPDVHGPGPYPVVVFLHGSGGLWSNDTIPATIASNTTNSALAS